MGLEHFIMYLTLFCTYAAPWWPKPELKIPPEGVFSLDGSHLFVLCRCPSYSVPAFEGRLLSQRENCGKKIPVWWIHQYIVSYELYNTTHFFHLHNCMMVFYYNLNKF